MTFDGNFGLDIKLIKDAVSCVLVSLKVVA